MDLRHKGSLSCAMRFIKSGYYRLLLAWLLFSLSPLSSRSAELTVWDFKSTDETTRKSFLRVDNNFRKKTPHIKLVHKGFYDQEYIPALRAALLAGTGPDIFWLHPGTEFSEYAAYLEPVDEVYSGLSRSLSPESLNVCKDSQGILKGLPLTFQGIGWYYNKTLFRRAGLDPQSAPVAWDDFKNACKVLRENGITPIATGNNRPLTTDFIRRMLVSSFFTDQEIRGFYNNSAGITSPRYRIIMEFLRELRDNSWLDEDGIFRPYFNYAPEAFSSGKAAMIPGLLSDVAHWKTFSDALGAGSIGYFPNLVHERMERPGIQLVQPAGAILGVNKDSPNKKEAMAYLKHLFSDESGRIFIHDLGMLIPGLSPDITDPSYPVLSQIAQSLEYTGSDLEQFIPSVDVQYLQYRLEDLLLNTAEITVDNYLIHIADSLRLY